MSSCKFDFLFRYTCDLFLLSCVCFAFDNWNLKWIYLLDMYIYFVTTTATLNLTKEHPVEHWETLRLLGSWNFGTDVRLKPELIFCLNVKSTIRKDVLSKEGLSLCLQLSVRLSKDNVITGPSLLSKCHWH